MTHDVTKAIAPRSDQLNADNLITGPMTIRIREVRVDPEAALQPIWIFFDNDDGKPWKPCKSSSRCLASIYGPNAKQWIGMHVTIYNDPTVTFGGAVTGGIRISHMEGLDKPRNLSLTKTRGKKGTVTIQPLIINKPDAPPVDNEPILQAARDAANKGKDEFRKWWSSNKSDQAIVNHIMDELKQLASNFDAKQIDDDEKPL